jgi:hypothetical protein
MPSNLKNRILQAIETQKIHPTPQWRFMVREWGMWCAVFLALAAGGISVGVSLYAAVNSDVGMVSESGTSFVTLIALALWTLAFIVMVATAVFNILHTRRGYRYPMAMLLGLIVLISLGVGGIIFAAGYGRSVDEMASKMLPYTSIEARRHAFWLKPSEGRLVGQISEVRDHHTFIVLDRDERQWEVQTPSAFDKLPINVRLKEHHPVVVFIGVRTGTTTFEACAMRPWGITGGKAIWHRTEGVAEHERNLFIMRKEKCERVHTTLVDE